MKKNTHKKRNFKKTRKYKTRNLRKTVKHNKRNLKKTRKYKGGVMPWNRAQEREKKEREEEEARKKAQEDEKAAIEKYATAIETAKNDAFTKRKLSQNDEIIKETKLKLWNSWAIKKEITGNYSEDLKIRAVNKALIYYYFKEYLVNNQPQFNKICEYYINQYDWNEEMGMNYKGEHSYYIPKIQKTPPITFQQYIYLKFLKNDTIILSYETKVITDITNFWHKLPKYSSWYGVGNKFPEIHYTTTYEYSTSPDKFISQYLSRKEDKPNNINDYANEILNKRDPERDPEIDNSKLFEYIFEPKIIPEENVDEKENVCIIRDGYVVNKYTYTGKDGEIEESVDECLEYNTPDAIAKRKQAEIDAQEEYDRLHFYDSWEGR